MEKEINVYDLNESGCGFLYDLLRKKGVKINRIGDLPPINNSIPMILVPATPIKEKNPHWDKILGYIEKNQTAKVLFIDWSDTKSELENLIGKDKNVEFMMTQETKFEDYFYKVLNKLGVMD